MSLFSKTVLATILWKCTVFPLVRLCEFTAVDETSRSKADLRSLLWRLWFLLRSMVVMILGAFIWRLVGYLTGSLMELFFLKEPHQKSHDLKWQSMLVAIKIALIGCSQVLDRVIDAGLRLGGKRR